MNSAVMSSVKKVILNQTKKSLYIAELHQASYQMYRNFAFCAGRLQTSRQSYVVDFIGHDFLVNIGARLW